MREHYGIESKFVLSDWFEILDTESPTGFRNSLKNIEDENVTKVLNNEMFILLNKRKETPLLITPVIKQFLEEFRSPIDALKVAHKFADEIGTHPKKITPKITQFLKRMLKRGILIKEEDKKTVTQAIEDKNAVEIGQKLGQYIIKKGLVVKSKVELYVADDIKNKRECVLKILSLPSDVKDRYRRRKVRSFAQEFLLIDELQGHPAICQFYGLVKDDQHPYAAMEYIKGVSLRKYLSKNKLAVTDRLDLIYQVFSVMAHVHRCKILHGDLHSSNFMIEENGRVRLIDFDLGNHKKLQKGEVHREGGVHQYIPPERLDDNAFSVCDGRADYKSEVFQIGVIAYYILYGKLPFKAFTWKQLAAKIKHEAAIFEPKTESGELIPEYIINIIKKAMNKKRKDRFKNGKKIFKTFEKMRG